MRGVTLKVQCLTCQLHRVRSFTTSTSTSNSFHESWSQRQNFERSKANTEARLNFDDSKYRKDTETDYKSKFPLQEKLRRQQYDRQSIPGGSLSRDQPRGMPQRRDRNQMMKDTESQKQTILQQRNHHRIQEI